MRKMWVRKLFGSKNGGLGDGDSGVDLVSKCSERRAWILVGVKMPRDWLDYCRSPPQRRTLNM